MTKGQRLPPYFELAARLAMILLQCKIAEARRSRTEAGWSKKPHPQRASKRNNQENAPVIRKRVCAYIFGQLRAQ